MADLLKNNYQTKLVLEYQTIEEYQQIIKICQDLFCQKTKDYGTAWRILRLPSLTDQIYIKAQRIRSIQEKGTQKIAENTNNEFVGIINYCVIALIQSQLDSNMPLELPLKEVLEKYQQVTTQNLELLQNKNHDYGEAWRNMRVSSMTDIILMKILRIKQIENREGKVFVSEGVDANYQDILNYAVFCLILSDFLEE